MPEYRRTTTIDADPAELFQFLSKVENLPKYFTGVTEAHPATGDEVHVVAQPQPGEEGPPEKVEADATFSVDAERKALSWGSEGPHDYHGELQVTPHGDGAQVEVTLHTQHDDDRINDGMDDTLQHVRELVAEGRAG
ncbi:SRPBCC family protein [Spongisporangium articulatum]|uniref:SRPBCC family protein n=1 Tax=Spongisporangium articulatum TaxID=3362603 RepID=A0ABW8AMH7_9ACTN